MTPSRDQTRTAARLLSFAFISFALLALANPATSSAGVTLGSSLASPLGGGLNAPIFVQTALPGRTVVAPYDGVVLRWRVRGASSTAIYKLRVLHPIGGGAYTQTAESAPLSVPAANDVIREQPTQLRIRAGDFVGLSEQSNNIPIVVTTGAEHGFFSSDMSNGDTGTTTPGNSREGLYNADIERDADGDGFSDETQDQCFTDPSTQAPCPAPTIAGQAQTGQTLTATPNGSPMNPSYQWLRCDGAGANCSPISGATATTYTVTVADQGHTLRFRKSASNSSGTQVTDSAQTALVPTPIVLPVILPPTVSGASMTRRRFAVAPFATPIAARKKAPRGSAFRYTLSAAASVKIQIFGLLPGRKAGRKCAPQSKRNRKKRRCTRLALRGTLTRLGSVGKNTVPFSGRIGKKALKPGRYQAAIVATNVSGASSKRNVSFTIVRR